jgi:hypothetical protein
VAAAEVIQAGGESPATIDSDPAALELPVIRLAATKSATIDWSAATATRTELWVRCSETSTARAAQLSTTRTKLAPNTRTSKNGLFRMGAVLTRMSRLTPMAPLGE